MGQQLSSLSISLTLCKQRDTMTINSGSYCCVGQNAEETTPGTPGTYRKRTSSQQSTTSNLGTTGTYRKRTSYQQETTSNLGNLGEHGSSYIENSVNPENGTGHENGASQEHAAIPGNSIRPGNDISSGNCNDSHNDTILKYEATHTQSTSHNASASAHTQPPETSSPVPQNPPYPRKTIGLTDVEADKLHSESSGDDNYGATPYLETAPFMGKATMVKPLLPEENNEKKAENEILQQKLTMQECQSIAREENTGAVESSSKTRDELDDISFVGDKDVRPKQYSVKPKSSASPLKPIPKSPKTQKPEHTNDKEISRQELQTLHTDAKAILNPHEINTVNNTNEEITLGQVNNSSHVQPSSSQQTTNAPSLHNGADVSAHSSSHFSLPMEGEWLAMPAVI